jgi:hypothetical protein
MTDWLFSWWTFGAIVAAVTFALARLIRSLDRWKPVQGRDATAQQAEAELWATRIGDQTGSGG